MDSEELELQDRCLDEGMEPMKGSKPKKDHLLGVFVGLGGVALVGCELAISNNVGIEFRRLGEVLIPPLAALKSVVRSKIAPAVLGLESTVSRVGLRAREAGLSRPPGEAAETREDMLPDTECPGRAVIVLDVSLEISDSGRGINSRVSENPTRALPGRDCLREGSGLGREDDIVTEWLLIVFFSVVLNGCGAIGLAGSGSGGGWWSIGKRVPSFGLNAVGLFGALLPFGLNKSGCGWSIGSSLVDIVPETPRRWPLRGG